MRLERASSLPQMDLLTVDGELRKLDLVDDDDDEEDNVSTLELPAAAAASPETAATFKGHRTTQLWDAFQCCREIHVRDLIFHNSIL